MCRQRPWILAYLKQRIFLKFFEALESFVYLREILEFGSLCTVQICSVSPAIAMLYSVAPINITRKLSQTEDVILPTTPFRMHFLIVIALNCPVVHHYLTTGV